MTLSPFTQMRLLLVSTFKIYKKKLQHLDWKLVNYHFSNQLTISLENLEVVEDFKSLGAKIASSYDYFKRRCGVAWSQFWKLEKVWRSTKIIVEAKITTFWFTDTVNALVWGRVLDNNSKTEERIKCFWHQLL